MTTQSEAWQNLFGENEEEISDGDLMLAYGEVNNAIHCLKRIGGFDKRIKRLAEWSDKISKIQDDRQAANRPELPSMMTVCFEDGRIIFYGVAGHDWSTGTSKQTEQLRKQLEAVYETTTMVKKT